MIIKTSLATTTALAFALSSVPASAGTRPITLFQASNGIIIVPGSTDKFGPTNGGVGGLLGLIKGNGSNSPAAATAADVITTLGFTPPDKAGDTMTGAYLFNQTLGLPQLPSAVDLTYAGSPSSMANAIRFGTGNMVSACPGASCISSPAPVDHQRTSALISATTQDDGHSEEQTLLVETVINKGALKAYAASTAYSLNDNIVACNGVYCSVYRATVAGTSGASAPIWVASRPITSTKPTVTDNTVVWTWQSESAIATKLGAYIETLMYPGAGFSEGVTTNFLLQPGSDPKQGAFGVEHDFSNFSGTDCVAGVSNCLGMRFAVSGTNQVLAGIQMDGSGGVTPTSSVSTNVTSTSGSTSATVASATGIAVGNYITSRDFVTGTKVTAMSGTTITLSIAAISSETYAANFSTKPAGYWGLRLSNNFSQAVDIDEASSAAIGILVGNDGYSGPQSHSDSGIKDNSYSSIGYNQVGAYTNGIALGGTYSGAQLVGQGNFVLYPDGSLKVGNTNASASPITGALQIPNGGLGVGGNIYGGAAINIAGNATLGGSLTEKSTVLVATTLSFSNGAATNSGTLTNAPVAGNPTKWIPINDNGTIRYIPAW